MVDINVRIYKPSGDLICEAPCPEKYALVKLVATRRMHIGQ